MRVRVLGLACTVVLGLAACSSRSEPYKDRLVPKLPPPAERYATATRPPATPGERQLAMRGVGFDPALDCVAALLPQVSSGEFDAAQYRHALPLRCGSPLYPVRAQVVADDAALVEAVAAFERDVPSAAPLVLGTINWKPQMVVVFARRLIELDTVSRAGAPRITGRLLGKATKGKALISTERGLVVKPFDIVDGRFTIKTEAPRDATIELVYVAGQVSEPFARIELGSGSPLFGRDGRLMTRIGQARRTIGAAELQSRDRVGTCDSIPAQIDGVDVTDRARCFDVPLLDLDEVADEVMYRPMLQDVLLTPEASLIEIGASHEGTPAIKVRVLMRFETLAPEAARARVLDKLHQRWPQLAERKAEGLAAVLDTWSRDPDVFGSSAKYKPALDRVAGKWTKTTTYYDALTTARDLDAALALVQPEDTPTAVDVAVAQVRGKDGAMLHAIAVVLELP